MSGVGRGAKLNRVSSEGDGETGSLILNISDGLVSAIVPSTQSQAEKVVHTSTLGKKVPLNLVGIHLNSQ